MFGSEVSSSAHAVQLYESDDFLSDAVADFVCAGLADGEPALIIATAQHRDDFLRRLKARDAELSRVTLVDARELLSRVVVDGAVDAARFRHEVGQLIDALAQRFRATRVRAYGEMVDVLWRSGEHDAARRLEGLWNTLQRDRPFSLLCAYVLDNFYTEGGVSGPTAADAVDGTPGPTHRRAIELDDFVAQAPIAIHSVDGHGRILGANLAELELMGYPAAEYIGRPITDFHVEPARVLQLLERLRRGEVVRDFEARVRRKDGAVRHVLISSSARLNGDVVEHTRCFTRDITERKTADQGQARLVAELERRVKLDEMMAGIWIHELRNPLGAIMAGAQLAQRSALDERAAGSVRRILSSGERMAHMIDQLLDFTRARDPAGITLMRANVDLRHVAADVVAELQRVHGLRQLRVEATGDTRGELDADRLAQVFSNLLCNALEHGDPAAPVVLTVDGSEALLLRFGTHNAGVVPPDVLPMLFDPFLRAEHRRPGTRGLGLGLFISRELVRAHGGELAVTSSLHDGTRFTVTLPRMPAA